MFVLTGILIAVAVGVAFGIFLGGGLLFIVWPQINRSVYTVASYLNTVQHLYNLIYAIFDISSTLARFSAHPYDSAAHDFCEFRDDLCYISKVKAV